MVGANGTTAGSAGAVPGPTATDNVKFLRGDGTWATPAAAAGGSANQIQYNSGGVLTGNANFVYSGGNVGIGTTNPGYPLDVNTSIRTGSSLYVGNMEGDNFINLYSNYPYKTGIEFQEASHTQAWWLYRPAASRDLRFSDTVDRVTLQRGTGYVGIGTSSPGNKLHVSGSVASGAVSARVENTSGTSASSAVYLNNTNRSWAVALRGDTSDVLSFQDDTAGAIRMAITSNGNVGIGTTAPGQALTVVGTIETTSGGIKFPDGTTQTTSAQATTCRSGYLMIPADNKFSYKDFCVMKYEAKKDTTTGLATSIAAGAPWDNVSWYMGKDLCQQVGAHLITSGEWMTISRNIERTSINDIDAAAGLQLATGHSDNVPANSLAATSDPSLNGCTISQPLSDASNASCPIRTGTEVYYGTGDSYSGAYSAGAAGRAQMRIHVLSNGNIIWDFAGNIWSWVDMQCTTPIWYGNTSIWSNWNDANLTDWEKLVAGPNGSLTTANGAGAYLGCTNIYPMIHGGARWEGSSAGIYNISLNNPATNMNEVLGFRCAYTP
jgi:hypothetical protein